MFEERLKKDRSLDSILTLFDGIQPDETRFRWDKVIAFHLLLLAFINRFGYESQRSTRQEFLKVAQQARHPRILRNLVQSVDKLGLGKDPEISHIRWAIEMIDKRQESK